MVGVKNQFIELLQNRDKLRSTSLIMWLRGTADGATISDLQPAQDWCFDTEQNWNQCYTVRYRADGNGGIIAPLIRQFCQDLRARLEARQTDAASIVGNFRVDESQDWATLETSLADLDVSADVGGAALIQTFASRLHSALWETGRRLVLFCEVDKSLAKEDLNQGEEDKLRPSMSSIGLAEEAVYYLLGLMPERVVLVIAGVNPSSPHARHEAFRQLEIGPDYLRIQPPEDRSQRLLSDAAEGEDQLNIVGEVHALADAIAARDLDPPLVVGVLGGWGSGKSYVMNLLKRRLLEIRAKDIFDHDVRASSPYVGHFYLVHFDAWTYAKADLWASLMQEVLLALNDQISYEQLGIKPVIAPPITLAGRQLFDHLESLRARDGKFDEHAADSYRDRYGQSMDEPLGKIPPEQLQAQHDAMRQILIPEFIDDYAELVFLEGLYKAHGDASEAALEKLAARYQQQHGKPPGQRAAANLRKYYRQFVENLSPVIDRDHRPFDFLDGLLAAHGSFDAEALQTYREKYGQMDGIKSDEKLAEWLKTRHETLKNRVSALKQCAFDFKFAAILGGKDHFSTDIIGRIMNDTDAKTVLEQLDKDNVLWTRLQGLNERLRDELGEVEKDLKDKKYKLSRQQAGLEAKADNVLQRDHWRTFASELTGHLGEIFKSRVNDKLGEIDGGKNNKEDTVAAEEDQGELDRIDADKSVPVAEAIASIRLIDRIRAVANGRTLLALLVFALSTALVVGLAGKFDSLWTGLSAVLGGLLGGTAEAWHKANEYLGAKVGEFEAFDRKMQQRQHQRREAIVEKYQAEEQSYQQLSREVAELDSKIAAYHHKIGLTAGHPTLLDFISHRLTEEDYVERLGPLHQVQQDIKQLSDGLRHNKLCVDKLPVSIELDMDKVLFPRGLPRVVLFIDDLDRCPPDRVVEVLEAAQLLVKTNLFVVVMAMDVRYITKALEKSYTGVLESRGEPSGLDYIEKIVQIPYRVRPISEDAMPNYLRSQMLVKVDATDPEGDGGPATGDKEAAIFPTGDPNIRIDETVPQKVLGFDQAEVAVIEHCALATHISPRATKRLVNVMKLIKIIWYRTGQDDVSSELIKAVVFFLTLSARCAVIMRRVLLEMERTLDAGDQRKTRQALPSFIARTVERWRDVEGRADDWDFIAHASKKQALLPATLSLEDLSVRNVELIRSFSFVGEIDLPPEPHHVAMRLEDDLKINLQPPVS